MKVICMMMIMLSPTYRDFRAVPGRVVDEHQNKWFVDIYPYLLEHHLDTDYNPGVQWVNNTSCLIKTKTAEQLDASRKKAKKRKQKFVKYN